MVQKLRNAVYTFGTGLIAVFMSVGTVSAQGSSISENIWCGLWNGANFNLDITTDTCSQFTSNNSSNGSSTGNPFGGTTGMGNGGTMSTNGYAALGDSVAAGLGLAPASTSSSQDNRCGRSSQAYANQVASRLNLPLTFVACSGATAGDLVTSQGISGPNIPPQFDTAFANGVPRLMTITVGANDAHWDDFIRACYAFNCNTDGYTTAARAAIAVMQAKLSFALNDLQFRSGNQPPVVIITGYYNPLSSRCALQQQNITPGEITWLSNETSSLNSAIQSVAGQYSSFVHYVPVSFAGHDICSAQPWVQGLTDPAPFHPTATGQAVIARSIIPAARTELGL